MAFGEREWRLLRSSHEIALDRYCRRVLDDCSAVIGGKGSARERYLRLFRLLRKHDDNIARAFNDMRRSRAIERLVAIVTLGVVTDAELREFDEATQETVKMLADL